MTSLLSHRVRPSPLHGKAEPFTAAEIDAHPDADRIWATIVQMRKELRDSDEPSWREAGLG